MEQKKSNHCTFSIGECFIPARTCPALDDPDNGTLSTNIAEFGVVVIVQCNPGFTFPSLEPVIVLQCMDDGDNMLLDNNTMYWNDTFYDCQRKHYIYNLSIYLTFI